MAILKELKTQKLYSYVNRGNYYNIPYNTSSYANPLVCTNCKHDFREGDMGFDRYKKTLQMKFCPECGAEFTDFVNREGKSKKDMTSQEKEYYGF